MKVSQLTYSAELAVSDNINFRTSTAMSARNFHEDSPVAGHWKPEVVRVSIVEVRVWVAVKCDILLIFIVVLLSVDFEMRLAIRIAVGRPEICIHKNFLCIIWYCVRYFI